MALGDNYAFRGIAFFLRFLQWASAVIVMSLLAQMIHNTHQRGLLLKFGIVIASISVLLFIPALVAPFFPVVGRWVLLIDGVLSYLWLTVFIFTAWYYNRHSCTANAPPGTGCAKKHTVEAFSFLAFICTWACAFYEVYRLWSRGHESERAGTTSGFRSKERSSVPVGVPAGSGAPGTMPAVGNTTAPMAAAPGGDPGATV